MTSSAIPPDVRRDLRRKLRQNAGRWIARFYRRELLLARTTRGMQIEAQQEFNRELVKPLIREIGAHLAQLPERGTFDPLPELLGLEQEVLRIAERGSDAVRRLTAERLDAMTASERDWGEAAAREELEVEPLVGNVPQIDLNQLPVLGVRFDRFFGEMLANPVGKRVRRFVQIGVERGLTTDQIVRGLKGTRTTKGVLEQPRHDVAALVESAASAASARQRAESFEAIGVDKWRWLATLDTKTCVACGNNEQNSPYKVGEGPTFPQHPNCRCSPVPWFGTPEGTRASQDGQVDAGTSFPDWFKKQSAGQQDAQIGRKRGLAFRRGDLEFRQMVGTDLDPLSIGELENRGRV